MCDLKLNVLDDYNNELEVTPSKHSIDRFVLRYGKVYNEELRDIQIIETIFEEMFYASHPYTSEKLLTTDMIKDRRTYYLKSDHLIFAVCKESLILITVLYDKEHEYLKWTEEQ